MIYEQYPSAKWIVRNDTTGQWGGWLLPVGTTDARATILPNGRQAIKDIYFSVTLTPEEQQGKDAEDANELKISKATVNLIADLRALLAVKNTDKTAGQVRQQTNKNTKLILILINRIEALTLAANGD